MADAALTRDNQEDCLSGMTGAWGAMGKVAPFTAGPTLSRDMTIGDFTLATFTGSAPKTVSVFSDPYVRVSDQKLVVQGEVAPWIATAVPTEEMILGYVYTDSAGTTLRAAVYFDNPYPIVNPGDGFNEDFEIPYGA